MKKSILAITFLSFLIKLNAQQLPFNSQYMIDNYITNPAAAGSYEYIPIALSFKQQWVGFNEAPKTQMITAHSKFSKSQAIGFKIYNDVIGPLSRISFQASYAYHIRIDRNQRLSFGLSLLANQHKLNASSFNLVSQSDQILTSTQLKSGNIDADFGVFYYTEDYYVGISTPQLFQNKYHFGSNIEGLNKQVRHYFITGGYKFKINREFSIEPSTLIKIVQNSPMQVDINTRIHYNNKLWGGLSWRVKDAVSVMAGINYESFVFGYAFDMTTTDIRNYSSGSHEVYIAYRLSDKYGINYSSF